MNDAIPMCICGSDRAVLQAYLNEGCLAYPTDHIQNLCVQHYYSIQPRDEMKLVKIWRWETFEWYWSTRGVTVTRDMYNGKVHGE